MKEFNTLFRSILYSAMEESIEENNDKPLHKSAWEPENSKQVAEPIDDDKVWFRAMLKQKLKEYLDSLKKNTQIELTE